MFCPECGKPNSQENLFCQYCNALLVDNSEQPESDQFAPEQQYPEYSTTQYEPETPQNDGSDLVLSLPKIDPKKIMDFIKNKKQIVIPVTAIVVALIAFFSIGSSLTSPERIAKKYFEALTENDFKSMYSYVSAPEGDFVSKDAYLMYMESTATENTYRDIKNFTVEENDSYDRYDNNSSGQLKKYYVIDYIDDVTGYTGTYNIELVKQSKNTFLFFKNYKVALGDMVCLNVNLTVPSGFSVKIDDIALSNCTSDENGNDVYEIDAIFTGKHDLKLESDIIEPYESEVNFKSSYDQVELNNYGFFVIKDSVLNNLEKKAISEFEILYKSAIAGKSFSDIKIKSSDDYTDLSDVYGEICRHIKGYYEGTGLKSISFNSHEIQTGYDGSKECSIYNKDGLVVSVTLKLNYDCSTSEYSYFGGNTINNKTMDDSVQFSYKLVNGEWLLNGMNYYQINY